MVGRTATIVLGPPASGKSSLAEKIATDIKAAIVDPDDAKIFMAEYDGGLGAAAVHEESSHLTFGLGDNKGVAYEIIKEGFNVVIPKVGAKPGSIRGLITDFIDLGYDVRPCQPEC